LTRIYGIFGLMVAVDAYDMQLVPAIVRKLAPADSFWAEGRFVLLAGA
jgi:hypothetical protein